MNGTHLERRRRLRATPLKLHVGGLDAAELKTRRAAIGGAVVNPMFPERLRHLEADIVPTPSRPNFPRQPNNLIAVWPPWEQGFGDAFGGTLLPLGELSRLGELRKNALAISGPFGSTIATRSFGPSPWPASCRPIWSQWARSPA